MADDGYEESPDLQEDEEMEDDDMLSDQSQNDQDQEGSILDECGTFSENDAIESSENSRPQNTEEGDENFEDLIAQEEENTKVKVGAPPSDKFQQSTKASQSRTTTRKAQKPTSFNNVKNSNQQTKKGQDSSENN